jgi:hypothetical protein
MLYERNLVSNAEVSARMNEATLRIVRDGAPADSVMTALHQWLEKWAATHPAEVETARLSGGGYTAEARKRYAAHTTSRTAQIDSIRRHAREMVLSQARAEREAGSAREKRD